VRCSKCDADNREGARFCDKCGAGLSPKCPSCQAENRSGAKFCDACGAVLGGVALAAAPGAKASDAPIKGKIVKVKEGPVKATLLRPMHLALYHLWAQTIAGWILSAIFVAGCDGTD